MSTQTEIITKLRQLQAKGWTLTSIAQRLGVGRVTVSTWVNGHAKPAISLKILGVELDRMMRMRPVGAQKPGPKGDGA